MKTKTENPFEYSDTNRRFYTYDYYLRNKFGVKCAKVPIDAGFTCPNIDGTKGHDGCSYCMLASADRSFALPSIKEQYETHINALRNKWKDCVGIPYFQDYSNTYAPTDRLEALYREALSLPDAFGLHIATRADCLSESTVRMISSLAKEHYIVVELGLQTVHDITAERINRRHSYTEFLEGYFRLKNEGINVCIHIINGLPGESREMMLETVEKVGELHPHSLKIHLLHIMRGTRMADEYLRGEFSLISQEEYTDTVVSQLEILPPDIVIGRVTGDGIKDRLIAPMWSTKKFVVMNEIDKEFVKRGTYQGFYKKS